MHKMLFAVVLSVAAVGNSVWAQAKIDHVAPKGHANVQDGEAIFVKKCFQCHSVLEGQTRLGPSLYREMKGSHPKRTATEVRGILKDGKGKMPSFSESLTREDTDNLLAYLRSL
jgi:mono/diheme cytochrome c family protein